MLNYYEIFPGVGAFNHLFGPGRGEFEKKFSKNSNARGVARGGGMLKPRLFDWYISRPDSRDRRKSSLKIEIRAVSIVTRNNVSLTNHNNLINSSSFCLCMYLAWRRHATLQK